MFKTRKTKTSSKILSLYSVKNFNCSVLIPQSFPFITSTSVWIETHQYPEISQRLKITCLNYAAEIDPRQTCWRSRFALQSKYETFSGNQWQLDLLVLLFFLTETKTLHDRTVNSSYIWPAFQELLPVLPMIYDYNHDYNFKWNVLMATFRAVLSR